MRGFLGSKEIRMVKPILLEPEYLIRMGSMICQAMFGNGFLIGTIKIIIRIVLIPTRKVLKQGNLKSREEAPGLILQTTIPQAIEWYTALKEKMNSMVSGVQNQNNYSV